MAMSYNSHGDKLMRIIITTALICLFNMVSGCILSGNRVHVYVAQISRDSTDIVSRTFDANDKMSQQFQGDRWVLKHFFDEDCRDQNICPTFMRVDFMVAIHNCTSDKLYLYDEEFSTGYYNLTLDVRRRNGEIVTLTKQEGAWYRNYPRMIVVPPGTFLLYPVTLQPSVWKNLPNFDIGEEILVKARFRNGEIMRGMNLKPQKPYILESIWTPIIIKGTRSYDPLIGK